MLRQISMIAWCAYCQKFLGEREPFDDYSLSHGMCSNCKTRGLDIPEEAFARITKLKEFQKKLWQLGSKFDIEGARKLAKECFVIGVKPADFVMGFVSPILGKLASLPDFQYDQLTQLHEFCQELLVYSRSQLPEAARETDPDVLLIVVPGNKHLFGVQFLEMWLTSEGIRTHALIYEQTLEDIIDYCLKSKPKVVGFSISDADQLSSVQYLFEKLKSESKVLPLFIAGGYAVKYNQIDKMSLKGVSLIKDENKLFLTLKSHLSLGFLYDLQKNSTRKDN